MKCPNCGREIPDGSLFCEYCAAEIKIVPEYEPNLEDQISKGMESVKQALGGETTSSETADEEDHTAGAAEKTASPDIPEPSSSTRHSAGRRRMKLLLFFLVGALSTAAVMIFIYIVILGREEHSQSYYVGRAYQSASEGRYEEAADEIDQAISLTSGDESSAGRNSTSDSASAAEDATDNNQSQTDATLYLLKAEYLQKAGKRDLALGAASRVLDSEEATEDDIIAAYGRMISIYASYEEYGKIADLLDSCSYPAVVQNYLQYTLFDPVFSVKGGSYQDTVRLELTDEGDGSIFYTLDGSTPTTDSILYTEPIVLSGGSCIVSAVYINHFGLQSNVIREKFIINNASPEAPLISPKSGNYAKQVQITAEPAGISGNNGSAASDTDVTIYYTTDGTDPTTDSQEYTGPITMPQGSSIFRFIAVSSNGRSSEIVEREYNYTVTTAINASDGVNYILIALIQRGEIINTIGTRPDGLTMYTFSYAGMRQIGDVNYLIYTETLVDSAGGAVPTGRTYAVNAINGTVNLYDGSSLSPIG